MSAIDRLFDLVDRQSLWSTTMPTTTTVSYEKVETTEQMSILPDTPNGPMLEVATKNKQGVVMVSQRYNLPAVDDLIGKLIKYRDMMATMEKALK